MTDLTDQLDRIDDALADAEFHEIKRARYTFTMREWTNGPDHVLLIYQGNLVVAFKVVGHAAWRDDRPHAANVSEFQDVIAAITK